MKSKKAVRIELFNGSLVVAYTQRQKHQRHWAAQFDARDHTVAYVEQWVRRQPHLELAPRS